MRSYRERRRCSIIGRTIKKHLRCFLLVVDIVATPHFAHAQCEAYNDASSSTICRKVASPRLRGMGGDISASPSSFISRMGLSKNRHLRCRHTSSPHRPMPGNVSPHPRFAPWWDIVGGDFVRLFKTHYNQT